MVLMKTVKVRISTVLFSKINRTDSTKDVAWHESLSLHVTGVVASESRAKLSSGSSGCFRTVRSVSRMNKTRMAALRPTPKPATIGTHGPNLPIMVEASVVAPA